MDLTKAIVSRMPWRIVSVAVVLAALLHRLLFPSSNTDTSIPGSGAMFDGIAPYYDVANKFMSLGLDMSWRRELIKKLELVEDDKILDLATGTADVAILLGQALNSLGSPPSGSITGMDPSQGMLKFGAEKVKAQNLDNIITLAQGDSQALDAFENNTFTKISMSFGIRNVPDRPKALREMRRVINSNHVGSKLAILEFSQPLSGPIAPIVRWTLNYFVPAIGSVAARGSVQAYEHLRKSIFDFPSPNDFIQMMHEAGFANCVDYNLSFDVVHLFICDVASLPAPSISSTDDIVFETNSPL